MDARDYCIILPEKWKHVYLIVLTNDKILLLKLCYPKEVTPAILN